MADVLTNPPMPEWNALKNEERRALGEAWEMYSCPHSCGGDVLYVYNEIRKTLQSRERRVFEATMAGPSPTPSVPGE